MAFSIVEVASTSSSSTSFTLTNTGVAIPAGALLFLGFAGSGFGAGAGTLTSVADNVNGSWITPLYQSGSQHNGSDYWSLGVDHFPGSAGIAAGSLTVTVVQVPGQSPSAVILGYITGGKTSGTVIDVSADNPTNSSSPDISQAIAGALAGDFGLYIGSSYATGGSITPVTGTTILATVGAGGGPPVLWVAYGTSLTSAGTNTYTVNLGGSASFMATWAAGYLPGGSSPVSGSGAGAVAFSGSATPKVISVGEGTGALAFSGSATPKVIVKASGAGAMAFSGEATAGSVVEGAGSGSLALSGAATPTVISKGAGTGALQFGGFAVPSGTSMPVKIPSGRDRRRARRWEF